jgi:AcrR family transcriptional regulator
MPYVSAEERREQLIAAAISVMATSGLDATTSRRIADAAGAPLASIHYTFDSLEALIVEAYARVLDDVLTRLDRAVPRTGDFAAAFAALADAVADVIGDPDTGILLIDLNPANDARLHDVGRRYYDFGPDLVRSIAAQVERGSSSRIDADRLGRLVMAAIDGIATQYAVFHDADRLRGDLRALLAALVPDDASSDPAGSEAGALGA